MKQIKIGFSDIVASQLALGMMRSSNYDANAMQRLLEKALECNINFVDHADIYAWRVPAEELYGEVLTQAPSLRDKFIIQTKCGICNGYYDSSYEHIMESVDQSLSRMNIDSIDILLLHRPDALMELEEIAKAFDELQASGKVKHFGVSNMNPGQIQLIESAINQKLLVDQMQMSIVHAPMIDQGVYVNMYDDRGIMRDASLLDYARMNQLTIQAWSIMQANNEDGSFLGNEKYATLNLVLNKLAKKYDCAPSAIALAWLLRHPANIQPIAGTVNPIHLEALCKAFEFNLTRPEWYELYLAAGRQLP